jgi:nucleoside-diphosphate-sugar epimerase
MNHRNQPWVGSPDNSTDATNPLAADLEYVLGSTRYLWEELRGCRLFITGGTGFMGCWLLESFIWANDALGLEATAVVLTRNQEGFRRKAPHLFAHPAIHLHQGDVWSFEVPEGKFSHIIHAATQSSTNLNSESPLLMLDTIIQGTRKTLELARKCGVSKFLLTSSGAVYGKQPRGITHLPEDYRGGPDPLGPDSAYGEGKRTSEFLCSVYSRQYGLEVKIARCFAFVGPYLPLGAHFAIGNFIRDGLAGKAIQVRSDGSAYRSYLYAADLAIWLWTILLKGTSCYPYNVGSEHAMSIGDIARLTGGLFQPPREVQIALKLDPKKAGERYIPLTLRARSELGLHESVGLPQAIRRTVNWHLGKAGEITEDRPIESDRWGAQ